MWPERTTKFLETSPLILTHNVEYFGKHLFLWAFLSGNFLLTHLGPHYLFSYWKDGQCIKAALQIVKHCQNTTYLEQINFFTSFFFFIISLSNLRNSNSACSTEDKIECNIGQKFIYIPPPPPVTIPESVWQLWLKFNLKKWEIFLTHVTQCGIAVLSNPRCYINRPHVKGLEESWLIYWHFSSGVRIFNLNVKHLEKMSFGFSVWCILGMRIVVHTPMHLICVCGPEIPLYN